MKIKKYLLAVCLSVALVAAFAGTAFAASWTATFDGKSMTTNYSKADITEVVTGLQPGSDVSFTVGMSNTYDGETEWYLTNKVLKSLEENAAKAANGAYTYKLTYVGPNGTRVLFDSDKVGGDGSTQGMGEATNATQDWFFLDKLGKGATGQVTVEIALDGETQGNNYMNTVADLAISFAAEIVDSPQENKIIGLPKTGDNSMLPMILGAVVLGAGLVILWSAIAAMKRNRKEEE